MPSPSMAIALLSHAGEGVRVGFFFSGSHELCEQIFLGDRGSVAIAAHLIG